MTDLPLSPLDFSVLLVLADEASYGYGIAKAIADGSAGAIQLAPGNLYQVLDRLLEREWIRELAKRELPEGADGRRRYYAITAAGRAVAGGEAARLRAMMPRMAQVNFLPEGA